MLLSKTSPVGIDVRIGRLQKILYTQLKKAWGITDDISYQCYPRCYKNNNQDGFVAELYTGGVTNNYEDVYYDDRLFASSFFGVTTDDKITEDNQEALNIHLVFFTNLSKIYPLATQRMDLEARLTVQKILDSYGSARGFLLKNVSIGLDKCLAEYPKSKRDINLKNQADQQPGHCFRFDMQIVNYQPTQTECGSE